MKRRRINIFPARFDDRGSARIVEPSQPFSRNRDCVNQCNCPVVVGEIDELHVYMPSIGDDLSVR